MKTFQQILQEQILSEVFVIGNKKPVDGDSVIAYNKWVWVVDDDNFDEYKDDIMKKLKTKEEFQTPDDVREYVDEKNIDVIYGTVYDRYLNIAGKSDFRQSVLSTDLHKVIKALKLQGVETNYSSFSNDLEGEHREEAWEFGKSIKSQTFYHGTSYANLTKMLKTGIRAVNRSNYTDIIHDDKVFITVKQDKAYYHAEHAAGTDDSFPVLIALKVPDPNKLVLDYDVALDIYGRKNSETIRLGYSDIAEYATRNVIRPKQITDIIDRRHRDKNDLNTKLGVFGYSGRIPAKFFEQIILDSDAFRSFYYQEYMGDHYDEVKAGILGDWDSYTLKEFENLKGEIEEEIDEEREEEDDWGEDDE